MATFTEGVAAALRTFPCIALANAAYANGAAGRIFGPTSTTGPQAAIAALRRALGCDPDDDPEPPEPPFAGGQCDGELYIGSATYVQSGTTQTVFFKAWGPIGGFTSGSSDGTPGVGLLSRGSIIRTGTAYTCVGGIPPTLGAFEYRQFAFGTAVSEPAIASITACGEDDCGDLPPVFPPAEPIEIDIDVTYNIDEGDEITVTIPFVFAPINVDIVGRFNIPFTLDVGGIELSGTVEISPEFNVNFNPPAAPRGTDDEPDDILPGPPADEVEPREFDNRIIGVLVLATIVGEQQLTTIATTDIPPIFAPRAGSIKFAYSIGNSTAWSNDIDVKGGRSFIPCPFSQGADGVAVSPGPGVDVQWQEITGPPLATVADLV